MSFQPWEEDRQSVAVTDPDVAQAERLVDEGRLVEAVDLLRDANRRHRDPGLEMRLIELRRAAAESFEPGPGRSPWPPAYRDPFPDIVGRPPEIDASQLDTEVLGGSVLHHGSLIVRGLLDATQVGRMVDAVEQALEHSSVLDEGSRDEPGPWYRPVRATPLMDNQVLRRMVAGQGGIWLADSPTSTAIVLRELEEAAVIESIATHFGERPFFSLQKATLRRSLPINKLAAWHQDGSFLSPDVRTMNTWVALSACGGDYPAPGLEIVPRRVSEVLPVDGVLTPHSIPAEVVDELAAQTPTMRPEFAAGDAMLFDERLVHRTYLAPTMTETRYALECWFFAPSHHSSDYVPLLV